MNFKKKELSLSLELNGRLLHQVRSSGISGDITIGRDRSCVWQIPATDKSASSIHARIFIRRGRIFVKDEKSRNGIYRNGAKIGEHKLAAGDRIGIGDCMLAVETFSEPAVGDGEHAFNRLEQLNGEKRGMIYDLDRACVRIGSDADCELAFPDTTISHFHAVIEQKEDDCSWIRDSGSRNGTQVNGVALSANANDSGRLLQDGDVITVSYLEFRFLDKHVTHVRSHIRLKTAAVILTLAICIGGYFAWHAVMPSAKWRIDQARLYAAQKNFSAARIALSKAANANGADTHRIELAELTQQIDQWEQTIRRWQEVKALIVEKKWLSANNILSPMLSTNMELWRWNDSDANDSKREAQIVKKVIDSSLRGRTVLEDIDSSAAGMEQAAQAIQAEWKSASAQLPANFAILLEFAADIRDELTRTQEALAAIDRQLGRLRQLSTLEEVIGNVEAQKSMAAKRNESRRAQGLRCSSKIETACRDLLEPLNLLREGKSVLDANYTAVAAMKFDAVVRKLPLPTPAQCNTAPVLVETRLGLEALNTQLLNNMRQLESFRTVFRQQHLTPGRKPECIVRLTDDAWMQAVFGCDSLRLGAPQWNRTAPSGNYDRMLGIESFFDFLKALPDDFSYSVDADAPFVPDILMARRTYSHLDAFVEFLEKDSMRMIRDNRTAGNKVAEFGIYAYELLDERNVIVRRLLGKLQKDPGREGVIAGGMALLLAGDNRETKLTAAQGVAEKFKQIRLRLSEISGRETTPEQMIANRETLLQLGIPGDSLIRQAWQEGRKNP